MPSYRPITDCWILARSKVKYYGAFPAGFLHRARALLGVRPHDPVLHVCGGMVRQYPYRGFGPYDKTLDLDPACAPDFLQDARDPFPYQGTCTYSNGGVDMPVFWPAVLIDRPYTMDDADQYTPTRDKLPSANQLVAHGLNAVVLGGKVGILDYLWPRPPKHGSSVAVVLVLTGFNNRARVFSVFERIR